MTVLTRKEIDTEEAEEDEEDEEDEGLNYDSIPITRTNVSCVCGNNDLVAVGISSYKGDLACHGNIEVQSTDKG